jgi:hypothetical protein
MKYQAAKAVIGHRSLDMHYFSSRHCAFLKNAGSQCSACRRGGTIVPAIA